MSNERLCKYIYCNLQMDYDKLFSEYYDELINNNNYLPCYLRGILGNEYYMNIINDDDIQKRIINSRKKSYSWKVNEIYSWFKNNKKYQSLIDMDELERSIIFLNG